MISFSLRGLYGERQRVPCLGRKGQFCEPTVFRSCPRWPRPEDPIEGLRRGRMGNSPRSLHLAALAPAKLNLSLRIVGRRADGYHLLDSCMVPISVYDRLELTFVAGPQVQVRCRVWQPGTPQDGDNLAARAAHLFMRQTGITGSVSIAIDKEIPIGAGLGGGSSDAAAVLRMLARGLANGLGLDQLAHWSVDLGADVPFFVYGIPARVGGVGEHVEQAAPPVTGPVVVVFPGTGLSTVEVYRAYDDSLTRSVDLSSGSLFASDQGSFREILVNDLEAAAMRIYPPLRLLKLRMFELGASGALMTGSGSALFGIWKDGLAAQAAATTLRTTDGLWARSVEILTRTPEVEIRDSRSMN